MKAMGIAFEAKALAVGAGLLVAASMATPAHAFSVGVDEILYEPGSGLTPSNLSASISMVLSGSTLKITLTNNTPYSSATGSKIILTGLGFSLPSSVGLNCSTSSPIQADGCKVKLGSTASGVNFSAAAGSDISNEWGWERHPSYGPFRPVPAGELTEGSVNTVVAAFQDATDYQFASGSTFSPTDLGGSEGGLLSADYANSAAAGLKVIKASVVIDLALSGTIPLEGDLATFINAGHVAVSFGTGTSSYDPVSNPSVPEPAGLGLIAVGLLGTAVVRRRRQVAKN